MAIDLPKHFLFAIVDGAPGASCTIVPKFAAA